MAKFVKKYLWLGTVTFVLALFGQMAQTVAQSVPQSVESEITQSQNEIVDDDTQNVVSPQSPESTSPATNLLSVPVEPLESIPTETLAEPVESVDSLSPEPTAIPITEKPSFGEPYLTGDWGGLRSQLHENGVDFDLEFTQFFQGLASGSGSHEFEYGGRLDALIDLNTKKLGLWEGGGFHTHLEYRYGNLSGFQDGILLPVNSAMVLPVGLPDSVVATSLYYSQKIGDSVSLRLGKINAVDLIASDLFFGGWGTERFMNIVFVAPPSGVVPPVIIGAVANAVISPVVLTLMVFDPNDQTDNYGFNGLFNDGVNISLGATYLTAIDQRPTTFAVTGTYSTKEGLDLNNVLLPPGLNSNSTKTGSYNIAFQFSHLFHVNPDNPREGWGLFLKAAIADGNPNIIQNSIITGLGGKGLFEGREQDSFGLGFFYYNFSDDLQDALNPLIQFNNEYGFEAYYSVAITPWFYLTGDVQYVNPANNNSDNAWVLGLRTRIRL